MVRVRIRVRVMVRVWVRVRVRLRLGDAVVRNAVGRKVGNRNSLVATPTITATNGATEYVINGDAVTLTCSSTSDAEGTGTYEWKHNSIAL